MTAGRGCLLVVGLVLAVAGSIARAIEAQPTRLVKIGALTLTDSWGPTPSMVGLREGLIEQGYREGEHFEIGVRFTQGDIAALPGAASDLVRHRVDVIFVMGANAAKAAQGATSAIPIVFAGAVGDPVGLGLVQGFARPGGNITASRIWTWTWLQSDWRSSRRSLLG